MLIEFKVSNFLSIRNQQTFSLVASPIKELSQNIFLSGIDSKLKLVRAAVIYGANAAGKSNVLSGLSFMRFLVKSSAKESQEGEKIPVEAFLFEKGLHQEPSEFEITFIKEKIRYQYGFVVDKNRIYEEWLFAYPSGRTQQWFSRIYDKKQGKYIWKFSKFFRGGKHLSDLTRDNVLFLSRAVDLNNEELKPVFNWFQKDLLFIDPTREGKPSPGRSISQIENESGKQKILSFIKAADASITDITQEKIEKVPEIRFPDNMPPQVRDYLKKEITGGDFFKIKIKHNIENAALDLHKESAGTIRSFALAGFWIDAIEKGQILIIDELDNSLHPKLTQFLINLICNPKVNKKNAQLIFSTHDTSLLDNELFRRDQIWFVEKDKHNATQLYSLLDFSPRKHEAIAKGYLQGRYGALPYIGEWGF